MIIAKAFDHQYNLSLLLILYPLGVFVHHGMSLPRNRLFNVALIKTECNWIISEQL